MIDFKMLQFYLMKQQEFLKYLKDRAKEVGIASDYYEQKLLPIIERDLLDILHDRHATKPSCDCDCTFLATKDGESMCTVTTVHEDAMPCLKSFGTCAWYRKEPVVLGEEMAEYIAYRKKLEKKLTSYQEQKKGDIII